MFAGLLLADLRFPGCLTLKDRRGILHSILDRIRNLGFSATQTGPADLVRRAWVACSCACRTASSAERMLDSAEAILDSPGVELASVDRRTILYDPED
jgi:uncharacterized protein YlxP (DUF503 family)